jgi:catechol 2,3-dioxygenase-like lactoylglutathione lyase family enzyme
VDTIDIKTEAEITSTVMQLSEMKIEVIVIPVSDVDRAKRFYTSLGWRLDMDIATSETYRAVQLTPPGSSCSIMIGQGITSAPPGSVQGLHLVVSDIVATRAQLLNSGVKVSEPFHDPGGVFHHVFRGSLCDGLQPHRRTYGSYATFSDPDGNGWTLQEVTGRLLGDVDTGGELTSAIGLQKALQHAQESYEHDLDRPPFNDIQ